MTHAALSRKYVASKSTIAWHLRRNGNGNGEASQDVATNGAEVAQHREDAPPLEAPQHSPRRGSRATPRARAVAGRALAGARRLR